MQDFNYKIPYEVAQNKKLSPLANFLFAEIDNLHRSKELVFIGDKRLANTWHKSPSTIQKTLKQLKTANYIKSRQVPNRRGRLFSVHNISENDKFILVPNSIKRKGYDTKLLTLKDLRIYGFLYSEFSKELKIKIDSYAEDENIIINVRNQDIANFFNLNTSTVYRSLKKLAYLGCINLISYHGKGLEIELNVDLIINPKRSIQSNTEQNYGLNENSLMETHFLNHAKITNLFNELSIHSLYLNIAKITSLKKLHCKNYHPNLAKITSLIEKYHAKITSLTMQKLPTNRVFNRYILINNNNRVPLAQNHHPQNQNNNLPVKKNNDLTNLELTNSIKGNGDAMIKSSKPDTNKNATGEVVNNSSDLDNQNSNSDDTYRNLTPDQASSYEDFIRPIIDGTFKKAKEEAPVKQPVKPAKKRSVKHQAINRFITMVQLEQLKLTSKPHRISEEEILKLKEKGYNEKQIATMIETKN